VEPLPVASAYRSRRRRRLRAAYLVTLVSVVLFLLDMTTPFPTPVRGPFALWWVIGVIAGGWLHTRAGRLPIEEALLVARDARYAGELQVTDLVSEFEIEIGAAEQTLALLEARGYATVAVRDDAQLWRFPEAIADDGQ
jgi:hypothetical protein